MSLRNVCIAAFFAYLAAGCHRAGSNGGGGGSGGVGGGGSGGGGGGGSGGTCAANTMSDPNNCGACGTVCAASQLCSAGVCTCPTYSSLCNGQCIPTTADPNNCGGCGVTCPAGKVCSAGVCSSGCITGVNPWVVACPDGTCADTGTDNKHCGNCTTDCTTTGKVCINGACQAGQLGPVRAAPACDNGGPPVSIGDSGTTQTCAGTIAQVTFRWGLCSCDFIDIPSGTFCTDGYDSTKGPYVGDATSTPPCGPGRGGGVGLNGNYSASAGSWVKIFGTLWGFGQVMTTAGTSKVFQELHVGGGLNSSNLEVGIDKLDAFVLGAMSGSASFGKDLYAPMCPPTGFTPSFVGTPAGMCKASTAPVAKPCDCDATQILPVDKFVAFAKTNNDNAKLTPALDPAQFTKASNPYNRLDLPCGSYYLDAITKVPGAPGGLVIVAHGHTALYIGGDINVPGTVRITLDPGSSLDLLVGGAINSGDFFYVGSPNYPALSRIYVAGAVNLTGQADIGGNLYAAAGGVNFPSGVEVYGAIYAKNFSNPSDTRIHYDRGVLKAADGCPPPPSQCNSCRDCGNQACINGTCGACTSSAQCCAPLLCSNGTCVLPIQ